MGLFSGIKKATKPLVDIPTWMGLRSLKQTGGQIAQMARALTTSAAPKHHESFEEAMVRLNLTEESLALRAQQFKLYIIVFLIVLALLWAYALWMWWTGSLLAAVGTAFISLVLVAQVFRYHFWLFQIRQRKLGCSFREWLWYGLLGRKS
jgi:intracellular multiplication protein IcmV